MFKFIKKTDTTLALLDQSIDHCVSELLTAEPGSDQSTKINDQLNKLIDTRTRHVSGRKISPDTWAMIVANLGGIALIMNYERMHVMASKAVGFVIKSKI